MSKYKSHIKTSNSITMVLKRGDPIVITKENPAFQQVSDALAAKMFDEAIQIADISIRVAERTQGRFKIDKRRGLAVFKDEDLPTAIADKLMQLVNEKVNTKPLEAFWANLKQNPSEESRKDLFTFLQKNKIPITDDGCFIGYKRVDSDFKDSYSKTFDNTPGMTVKMDRSEVDPNRNNTCSRGLHVAAFHYAAVSYGDHGNLLEVKVNPRDVVTVPPDYNQQKMRVCEYQVVGLATKEREDLVYSPSIPALTKRASKSVKVKGSKDAKDVKKGQLKLEAGRLRVPMDVIKAAGLDKTVNLAVRIDPRTPDRIRITAYNGRGELVSATKSGVYVPREVYCQIQRDYGTTGLDKVFNFFVENHGVTLTV